MKRHRTWRAVALALAVATAAGVGVRAQNVPRQLGLDDATARQSFLDSITSGYPVLGMAGKAFTALPAAARVTLVDGAFAWMKSTVNSGAFKTAYAEARENGKPTPPQAEGTVDEELKRKQDEQLRSLDDSKKALAMLPADQRGGVAQMVAQMEAQVKDPAMAKMMRASIEAARAQAQKAYDADLKKWTDDYPANPQVLVARRLQAFLTASATVDFAAKLVLQDGKMRFVNPEYEAKGSDWKMCFRAGREAVAAARTNATNWLKDLPH